MNIDPQDWFKLRHVIFLKKKKAKLKNSQGSCMEIGLWINVEKIIAHV